MNAWGEKTVVQFSAAFELPDCKEEETMKSKLTIAALMFAMIAVPATRAMAHCQIPCGIYDDELRFTMMLEHVTTIEKSMNQILELSKAEKPDYNQIVRWVNNKDQHADELSDIVTYYFMTQRVKQPASDADHAAMGKYLKELALLHGILVDSMKAKQTTDLEYCNKLRAGIEAYKNVYFNKPTAVAADHSHDADADHDHEHIIDAGSLHEHSH